MKQSGFNIMTVWIIQSREKIGNTDNTKLCEIKDFQAFFFHNDVSYIRQFFCTFVGGPYG